MEKVIDQVITILENTVSQLKKLKQKQKVPEFRVTSVLEKPEKILDEDRSITLALGLYKCMQTHNKDMKSPNIQKWAKDFEKIMRIDKREYADIVDMIKWTQKHEFWHINILSPKKLREKWDTLFLQREQDRVKNLQKNYDFGFK